LLALFSKLVEKGELILSRRPVESFKTADYGPCPHCSDWMLKTTFVRHQSKCKAPDLVQKLSNKEIILTSNIKSGHIEVGQVSELMLHEVFPTRAFQVMVHSITALLLFIINSSS
jgi:uncharacterized protein (DUF983 family)